MESKEYTTPSSSQRRGNAPLIIPQLLQAATGMRHIDELLLWLASAVVQRLDIQVVQFWANQASPTGQLSLGLRTNINEDSSLPQAVVYNPQVAAVVEKAVNMHQHIPLQPMNSVFSPHQANLFLRYGLRYCLGYFLSIDALLPPAQTVPSYRGRATPCTMFVLLALHHDPSKELFATLEPMFEQAILIAARRGFLLAAPAQSMRSTVDTDHNIHTPYPQQLVSPSLSRLIPRRINKTEAMKSDNPFTAVAPNPVIKDRTALRLYQAIDGNRTIADLAAMTRLKEQDVLIVLQTLLKQKLVQLFTAEGRPLDGF